jgi:hypothetical protein
MAIGAGWTDGAWVDAGWVYGAWAQSASAVVACSSATGTLHDEFVQTADTQYYDLYTRTGVAQSWQAGSNPAEVTGVCVRLLTVGTVSSGTITVGIYAHSGTYGTNGVPTGSALVASEAYDVTTLTASAADYFFALSGWTPSANTNYTIVVGGTGDVAVGTDSSNTVRVVIESGAEATHSGNGAIKTTGSWISFVGDTAFKVYYAGGGGSTGYLASTANKSIMGSFGMGF